VRHRRRVAGHGAPGFALRGGAGSSGDRFATYGFALHDRRLLCSSDFDVRSISLPHRGSGLRRREHARGHGRRHREK